LIPYELKESPSLGDLGAERVKAEKLKVIK
jgi:hypothetical protein